MTNSDRSAKISETGAEWRRQLSPGPYYVTRQHGTERAFSSPLNNDKRRHARLGGLRASGHWPTYFRTARSRSVRAIA